MHLSMMLYCIATVNLYIKHTPALFYTSKFLASGETVINFIFVLNPCSSYDYGLSSSQSIDLTFHTISTIPTHNRLVKLDLKGVALLSSPFKFNTCPAIHLLFLTAISLVLACTYLFSFFLPQTDSGHGDDDPSPLTAKRG